ncbi:hypothetical protein E2C01_057402 [Portunus trituberculatus]|uniref:Uncharacterized protein n=1 Tax=Portunus trituberculatus TaxID=210409 RepID=A0A5B7H0Y8_PORTR|nr:hypothetical protein [Portunus trituberculatus]
MATQGEVEKEATKKRAQKKGRKKREDTQVDRVVFPSRSSATYISVQGVVTVVIVSSPADGCFGWTVGVMEGGQCRSSHSSPGNSQALPPRTADGLSSMSEDDSFGGQDVPTTNVAGPSHSLEPDDVFCNSVVKKILPALVQALGAEKVRKVPVSLHDNDSSSEDDMESVPQVLSHAPISGASSTGLTSCTPGYVGASHSSAEEFVGFPVANDQHVTLGRSLGAAFDIDDARGPPVTEVLAKDIRSYLHMVPDDKNTRLLA